LAEPEVGGFTPPHPRGIFGEEKAVKRLFEQDGWHV
jgi:hypothetical protein